jgi:hypothetical protein
LLSDKSPYPVRVGCGSIALYPKTVLAEVEDSAAAMRL